MRMQGKAAEMENDHSSRGFVLSFGPVIGGGVKKKLHSSLWGVSNVCSLRGRRDVPSQVELVEEENNGDNKNRSLAPSPNGKQNGKVCLKVQIWVLPWSRLLAAMTE